MRALVIATFVLLGSGCGSSAHRADAGVDATATSPDDAGSDAAPSNLDGTVNADGGAQDLGAYLPDLAGVDFGVTKSIKSYTTCDGVTDDSKGVQEAFAAAKNNAFTLVFDCPVKMHIGTDIARIVYIDSGTTVLFTGAGKLIIDDVYMPAFVIANTTDVSLLDWSLEWIATYPAAIKTIGYYNNGVAVPPAGNAPAQGAFNNDGLTPWLQANRGITFGPGATSAWPGPTNTSAVFYLIGSTSNVNVTGMHAYVPTTAGGDQFIPMLFSILPGWASNQMVTTSAPTTSPTLVQPHDLSFSYITLDGYYMGWQGQAQNLTVTDVRAHRYGDVQDADGGTVGGVGKWFAPPHLFYINDNANTDPNLQNKNIHISNVIDYGDRVGEARDRIPEDMGSGYALSLKIGGAETTVDNYRSSRPDGLLDILDCNNMKLSNITGTYDSSFLNNIYPGIRYPRGPNDGLTLQNVTLTDKAASSIQPPMRGGSGTNITLMNVAFTLNHWAGVGSIVPAMGGTGQNVKLDYTQSKDAVKLESGQSGALAWQLAAQPSTVAVGAATKLSWSTTNGSSCTASGGWSGTQPANGTMNVTLSRAGTQTFTLTCTGTTAGDTGSSTISVTAQ